MSRGLGANDAGSDAIDSFTGKWRARWPEWAVAEVFVPPGQRDTALAWAALLQELTDAAWGGNEPRPGEAKLGWWAEELQGWSRGLRRHPLGLVLQKQAAPWPRLAAALPSLRDSRERPVDPDDAAAQLRAFALAVAGVESELFGPGPAGQETAVDAVTTALLHMRLAHHPADATPLQVLAQAEDAQALGAWTKQLAGRPAEVKGATRPRRVWTSLALARLGRGAAVQPLSAVHTLWAAWRGARG